jgi:hypothetical protein
LLDATDSGLEEVRVGAAADFRFEKVRMNALLLGLCLEASRLLHDQSGEAPLCFSIHRLAVAASLRRASAMADCRDC